MGASIPPSIHSVRPSVTDDESAVTIAIHRRKCNAEGGCNSPRGAGDLCQIACPISARCRKLASVWCLVERKAPTMEVPCCMLLCPMAHGRAGARREAARRAQSQSRIGHGTQHAVGGKKGKGQLPVRRSVSARLKRSVRFIDYPDAVTWLTWSLCHRQKQRQDGLRVSPMLTSLA